MRASGSFEDAQLLANSGLARSYIPVNSAFLKLWMHSKSSIPRIADDLFSKIEKKNLILSFQYIHMLVAIKSCPFSLVTSGGSFTNYVDKMRGICLFFSTLGV